MKTRITETYWAKALKGDEYELVTITRPGADAPGAYHYGLYCTGPDANIDLVFGFRACDLFTTHPELEDTYATA